MRALISAPPKNRRPDSQDPIIYDEQGNEESMHPGGWGIKRRRTYYKEFFGDLEGLEVHLLNVSLNN